MNVSAEEVRRQTALRQKRHRERVKEALRNARSDDTPAPKPATIPPLRLMVPTYDEDGMEHWGDYTETEVAADRVMDLVCWVPNRGQQVQTDAAEGLIALVETDPTGFADYARRFVAARVAQHQPKPTKKRKPALRNAALTHVAVPDGMKLTVRDGRATWVKADPDHMD